MRLELASLALALTCTLTGCGDDGAVTGNDAVQSADGQSAADTLMALISTRTISTDPTTHGLYTDRRQARSAKISVDGTPWGHFTLEEEAPPATGDSGGWLLHDEPSQALMIATLGGELDRDQVDLDTISSWVDLLERYLAPGDHVAVVDEITLERSDGELVTLAPRLLIPFEVEPGESSAYLGEITIELDLEGGAQ